MKIPGLSGKLMVIAILLSGNVCAGDITARPALVDQVLRLALVPELLVVSSREIQDRAAQDPRSASLTPGQREQVAQLLRSVFDTKAQYDDIAQALVNQFNADDFTAFAEAYSHPVVQKLNVMTLETYTPGRTEALQAYAASLEKSPPAEARIKQLARLDDLTGESEVSAEAGLAMMSRVAGIAPADPRYQSLKTKIMASSRERAILGALYNFQQASDAEVGQYVALHERPAVARVSVLLVRTFTKNLERGIERMMERMVDLALQDTATGSPATLAVPAKPAPEAQ
jgi:hypothetical protein